jgi:hypothetical protein
MYTPRDRLFVVNWEKGGRPLASPDPEKKMAKLQLFNTYTFAGEHYRSVKRPRYVIFNITHVQRLVKNIDNN